jgi:hypothetical protein
MKRFEVRRAYRYEPKRGSPVDTPDVFITDGDRLALVIECKATKLNYLAQFAEYPFEAEKTQYIQMANGAFQLWRFFSHVRRELLAEKVDAETAAMVVTLDPFRIIDPALSAKIMGEANALADSEADIIADDRRAIIFCPIDELEDVVCRTDEDRFLASLKATRDQKYSGWELVNINRKESEGKPKIEKSFPFALNGLLPWWERISEAEKARAAAAARDSA